MAFWHHAHVLPKLDGLLLQRLLPRHHLLVLLFQTIGEWIAEPSTRALGLVLSDFLPIMKQLHVLLHKRRKNRL